MYFFCFFCFEMPPVTAAVAGWDSTPRIKSSTSIIPLLPHHSYPVGITYTSVRLLPRSILLTPFRTQQAPPPSLERVLIFGNPLRLCAAHLAAAAVPTLISSTTQNGVRSWSKPRAVRTSREWRFANHCYEGNDTIFLAADAAAYAACEQLG